MIAVSAIATLEPLVVEGRRPFELLAWTLARVIEARLGRVQGGDNLLVVLRLRLVLRVLVDASIPGEQVLL